jgi:hypothetical protein
MERLGGMAPVQDLETKTDVGECMWSGGSGSSGAGNAWVRHRWRRLEADGSMKGT